MPETRLFLSPAAFSDREQVVIEHGSLTATAFRYESGVCALRITNEKGYLILLPFQGQQIWRAFFNHRDLTMQSMFDQPHPTRTYLETYGGFLIHCGMTAMGVPTGSDTHPLHGELPNAPYSKAWVIAGEDQNGAYLELGGEYEHTVAFNYHYLAHPAVRLYAGKTTFPVSMAVTNLKNSPMELMYLAHINFRPEDNTRLVYSAPYDAEHVVVRRSIPSHIHPLPGYREFIEELAVHPEKHHVLEPGLGFDPEVVFFIKYLADDQGWAHSLAIHPDGAADYVRHHPAQLDHSTRWICRTPDQDALGLLLPGTADSEGYTAEKAKGNLKILGAHETWRTDFWVGALTPDEASDVEALIQQMQSAVK